jgi:glycosyltransferase involved in cell wall biosynthesis
MNISLCMIVRNEAACLARCLESVRSLVQEINVVDTGSTDTSQTIAAGHGAKVYDFPWRDDFAAARNEALRHASQPWVLSMDADDVVDDVNRAKLAELISTLGEENAGYMMQCASVDGTGTTLSRVGHVRIFRSDPRIRWDHRVHEQIAASIEASGGEIRLTDVVIHHYGYINREVLDRKLERNLRLLELEAAELPVDPVTQFHVGWSLACVGRREEAIVALNLSGVGLGQGRLHRRRQGLLARCYYQTGWRAEAMAIVREARLVYPDDVELLHTDAQLRLGMGDLVGAEACIRAVLGLGQEDPSVECLDSTVLGSAGFYLLGLVCALQGKHAEAEEAAREATRLDRALLPAWVVLADSVAEQGRFEDLEELAVRADTPETVQALVRACALALRGEATEATRLLLPVPDEGPVVEHARKWVQKVSGPASQPARILDLLRA